MPAMKRNIELKTPRTPTLILDMLIGSGSPLTTDEICRGGALMGVSEGTIRVGLTRLKATGKIVNPERGLYEIAPAAHPLH